MGTFTTALCRVSCLPIFFEGRGVDVVMLCFFLCAKLRKKNRAGSFGSRTKRRGTHSFRQLFHELDSSD
jgi:hypothetical protein